MFSKIAKQFSSYCGALRGETPQRGSGSPKGWSVEETETEKAIYETEKSNF
jgi:hypothetical protein